MENIEKKMSEKKNELKNIEEEIKKLQEKKNAIKRELANLWKEYIKD